MSWCTIESDPGVFSELIQAFGASGAKVEECYAIDASTLGPLGPVYGLVFLFKHTGSAELRPGAVLAPEADDVFFANQVIGNACATQALLHVLLNSPVDLGPILSNFKSFTMDFPPDIRGNALHDSPEIRTAHNSFARPEPFFIDDKSSKKGGEAFHFVAYVPVNGKVYELDGLRPAPICLGSFGPGEDWATLACSEIVRRVEGYTGEIRFNLLAVCKDVRSQLQAQIAELAAAPASGDVALDVELRERLSDARANLASETEKFARYRVENVRRKHNYIPLVVALFKQLARDKALLPLHDAAKGRAEALAKARAERRRKAKEAASGGGGGARAGDAMADSESEDSS